MFGKGVKHASVSTNQALHRQVIEHMEHATTAVDKVEKTIGDYGSHLSRRKRGKVTSEAIRQADVAIHHLQAGREIGGVNGAAIQAIDDAIREVRDARSGVGVLYWGKGEVTRPLERARTEIDRATEEAADQTGFQNKKLAEMAIPGEDLL